MNPRTYLVTGGVGFIGAALVRQLIQSGHRVRVLDNQLRGSVTRLTDLRGDFQFMEGDVRDRKVVRKAAQGVDSVCHLASVNGTEFFYTRPELVLDVGVKGIVNILDACVENEVGELLLASSSEVYQTPPVVSTDETVPLSIPDPWNPRYSYAATKIISEIMVLNYGRRHFKRVVIFRPHNVYGPDMGWEHVIPQFVLRMKRLCKDPSDPVRFPIQGTGKETRSFVFIDDFIGGLMLVMERGEHLGIYHIGTSEEVAIEEVARLVGEHFGRRVQIVPSEPARGGVTRRCPDISKLVALGYRPNYAFREGLEIVVRWYEENAEWAPWQSFDWTRTHIE